MMTMKVLKNKVFAKPQAQRQRFLAIVLTGLFRIIFYHSALTSETAAAAKSLFYQGNIVDN
jgi:hypothetical protein